MAQILAKNLFSSYFYFAHDACLYFSMTIASKFCSYGAFDNVHLAVYGAVGGRGVREIWSLK